MKNKPLKVVVRLPSGGLMRVLIHSMKEQVIMLRWHGVIGGNLFKLLFIANYEYGKIVELHSNYNVTVKRNKENIPINASVTLRPDKEGHLIGGPVDWGRFNSDLQSQGAKLLSSFGFEPRMRRFELVGNTYQVNTNPDLSLPKSIVNL